MDIRQLKKHPFFTKMELFLVDLNQPRSTIYSLRYALNISKYLMLPLYIFPEGEIVPVHPGPLEFKRGLEWLRTRVKR